MSHAPAFERLQRGHPCKHLFYVYFSRLHRIIPTIYFAGVFVMNSTAMHFWYCLELHRNRAVITKSVHQRALLYTRKKPLEQKWKEKKEENYKTRAMLYSGLFSHINLVNPQLAIEVESEFPDMNYKGELQNSLKASIPSFQPGISAGTIWESHRATNI